MPALKGFKLIRIYELPSMGQGGVDALAFNLKLPPSPSQH